MATIPPTPKGLSTEAAGLWRTYTSGWELDEHSLVVLGVALETFDRMRQAQREIKRRGLVLRSGRVNPATLVERDSRRDLVKSLRSLGLVLDPGKDPRA
jgi:phage terminase small subunit